MKKDILNLPFFLLLAYSILCFFRSPQLSDSFIVMALAALYGYKLYINHRTPENKELTPEMKDLRKQMEVLKTRKEINALQLDISRMNTIQKSVEESRNSKVMF